MKKLIITFLISGFALSSVGSPLIILAKEENYTPECDKLAEQIIDFVNQHPSTKCNEPSYNPVYDVNKDRIITPLDSLLLINAGNRGDNEFCEKKLRNNHNPCEEPAPEEFSEESEEEIRIFPKLRVISPNGGEKWKRGTAHLINWETTKSREEIRNELWPKKVSIDLYEEAFIKCKEESEKCEPGVVRKFVKHIGEADLLEERYQWEISEEIKEGENYLIRITPSVNFAEREKNEKLIKSLWDESDGLFSIVAETTPFSNPDLKEIIKSLKETKNILQKTVERLSKVLELLERFSL